MIYLKRLFQAKRENKTGIRRVIPSEGRREVTILT